MKLGHLALLSIGFGLLSGCSYFKSDSNEYADDYAYNSAFNYPKDTGISDKYSDDNLGGGTSKPITNSSPDTTSEVPFSASRGLTQDNVGAFEN